MELDAKKSCREVSNGVKNEGSWKDTVLYRNVFSKAWLNILWNNFCLSLF